MHPKNIFHIKPMALVLGGLLVLVAPVQLISAWMTTRANDALVEQGVEGMARVVELSGGARIAAQSSKAGQAHCRWAVELDGQACVEIFALPCPQGITETPMIYLKDDPSVCRVLSRAAVAADEGSREQARFAFFLLAVGLALLALGRSALFGKTPQALVKER